MDSWWDRVLRCRTNSVSILHVVNHEDRAWWRIIWRRRMISHLHRWWRQLVPWLSYLLPLHKSLFAVILPLCAMSLVLILHLLMDRHVTGNILDGRWCFDPDLLLAAIFTLVNLFSAVNLLCHCADTRGTDIPVLNFNFLHGPGTLDLRWVVGGKLVYVGRLWHADCL